MCVCFQMLNNNFGIAPGGQSNKFDAPTIPKYANLILSNLCGCNPPPLYTTPPWLGLWKSNVPGPHLVRAGVGSPTMNPPPGGPFVPPSGGLVLCLSISRCSSPLSYFSSDSNHSASPRLAALTLRRRLCLIFFIY